MNNRNSWIDFPPDNFGQGMGPGGRNWPDQMFVQFWEIHPDSMPGRFNDRIFGGYHIQVHDRDRVQLMTGNISGRQGMLRFERQHHIRLRYYEEDLGDYAEGNIIVWAWDDEAGDWMEVAGAVIDENENVVTFETTDLASYYALGDTFTGTAIEAPAEIPGGISLLQNYPNPFNPITNIPYTITTPQHVTLEVFDLLGRKVAVLVDEVHVVGDHSVLFDGEHLSSGIYIYQLRGETLSLRRELILMK